VKQIYKVLSAGCTPATVGESSEWKSIGENAEKKKSKFCDALDGKPLSSVFLGHVRHKIE
jgi:ligand-binding SRPBCC domain-containing protein